MDNTTDKELKRGRSYCLRLLSVRARTEQELRSRLKRKGFSDEAAISILGALKDKGLVDDEAFAKEWIEYRQESKPRSRRLLEAELAKKGIDEKVIEKVFSGQESELNEKDIARDLVKDMLSESSDEMKAKAFQYLLRRGFDAEVAEEVINELTR